MTLGAAGACAALALVHRLHARDRNGVAFGDECRGQRLGSGHQIGPRVAAVGQPGRGVDGEVSRGDVVEFVPRHGKGHRHAWPDPRAVGRDDGGPAGPGRVDEHLAVPVLLDERGGRQRRIEPLGARGERPGRGRDVLDAWLLVERHEHVQALGAAGLHRAGQPGVGQRLADEVRRPDRERERAVRGRGIDVEDQMRLPVPAPGADQRRVVLDRPLVGEPQQRPAVVAQRVLDLAPRGLRPLRDRAYPGRRVLGEVLLHEGVLAAQHPDHRQRPVAQPGDHRHRDRVEVVDEIALGRASTVEQRLVEVGERDSVPLVAARLAVSRHSRRAERGSRRACGAYPPRRARRDRRLAGSCAAGPPSRTQGDRSPHRRWSARRRKGSRSDQGGR